MKSEKLYIRMLSRENPAYEIVELQGRGDKITIRSLVNKNEKIEIPKKHLYALAGIFEEIFLEYESKIENLNLN